MSRTKTPEQYEAEYNWLNTKQAAKRIGGMSAGFVYVSSALGVLFGWISFVGIGLVLVPVRGDVAEAHRKGHGS